MRLTHADEAATLAAIHASAFDKPWNSAAIASLQRSPGVFALVAEDASGFILIRVVADEAEVLTLAVTPAARRAGLGRRMIDAAAEQAAEHGATSLFLEVAADNAAAIALYAAAGFTPAGRRTGYYSRKDGKAVDALILKKALTPPA